MLNKPAVTFPIQVPVRPVCGVPLVFQRVETSHSHAHCPLDDDTTCPSTSEIAVLIYAISHGHGSIAGPESPPQPGLHLQVWPCPGSGRSTARFGQVAGLPVRATYCFLPQISLSRTHGKLAKMPSFERAFFGARKQEGRCPMTRDVALYQLDEQQPRQGQWMAAHLASSPRIGKCLSRKSGAGSPIVDGLVLRRGDPESSKVCFRLTRQVPGEVSTKVSPDRLSESSPLTCMTERDSRLDR